MDIQTYFALWMIGTFIIFTLFWLWIFSAMRKTPKRFSVKNMEPVTFYVTIQNREFLEEFKNMLGKMLNDGVIVSYGFKEPNKKQL